MIRMMIRALFCIFAAFCLCVTGCRDDVDDDEEHNELHRKLSSEEIELFKPLELSSNAVVLYQAPPDEREPRHREWIISIPGLKGKPTASSKYGVDSALLAEVFSSRGIVFNPKDVLKTWTVLWSEGGYEYSSSGVVFKNKTLIQLQRF